MQSPTNTSAWTRSRLCWSMAWRSTFSICVLAAPASHAGHAFEQRRRGAQPRARVEFAVAAVVAKLNIEAAERGGFAEHVALDLAGAVPAGLAAGGGVHREHQPPAPSAVLAHRCRAQLVDEGVDRGLARFLRQIFVSVAHAIRVRGVNARTV